ncbi:MAG TPA: hypothetical protein VIG24_11960 [Acidimicrobiia bacterium]
MKLIEIFDQLSHAELSQMKLGNGDLAMNPRDYPRVARSINLGLDALHKRFSLKRGKVIVGLEIGLDTYVLSREYAESNTRSQQPVKYILDSNNPFQDTILKIESIFDEEGEKVPLNVLGDPKSIHTTDERTLLVPEVTEADLTRRVMYRKGHRQLTESDWSSPDNTEVDLPYSHLEALCYFVASRLLNPLGGNEQGNHEGRYYMNLYEKACNELKGQGMEIERDYGAEKFRSRGFV